PWNDPDYEGWAQIGDHVFTLTDATVHTEASRLISLRTAGPVTLSDIQLSVPDSSTFELATPESRTGQLTATNVRFLDPDAPPVDSVVVPPSEERIRQLEAQVAQLQREVSYLSDQLATERATLASVRDELATAIEALDQVTAQLSEANARIEAARSALGN
ncbi:MAG: hypothetical protein AAF170_07745, partial [Bacteroidota bacterium]